jgi:hypothetical protein
LPYVKTNDQTKTRLNPVSFIHNPGKLSVRNPATAWRMTESRASPHNWQQQGTAPQDQGEPMEIQLIIGAWIAATAIITALFLRWQNDPLEEQIREAMQYETKQQKITKAIRK